MNWNPLFAKRTRWMRRNAIRELLKVTSRPEIISFAGGLPAAELFPLERVQAAVARVFETVGPRSLQYGETEGVGALRDWIARKFRVQRENVLITSGAQQALDLIGRVLLNEGDRVIVENPTYLALLSAWRLLGVEFVPVPSDADGMQVDMLEPLLQRQPKCIYLTPDFQNPQGTTLSQVRRGRLIELARERCVPIVEDCPYSEVRFSGVPLPHLFEIDGAFGRDIHQSGETTPPALATMENCLVIHVGTFSKVLMPGLRIGWVVAAREVIDKLVEAKQPSDLHTSTFNQHIALELASNGCLEEFVPLLRQAYAKRRDSMLDALAEHFPQGVSWTRPDGGMFLLVTLPEQINAAELLPAALQQKVAFVPGEEFHLNGEGKNTLRLNFSNATPEQISTGIARLAGVVKRSVGFDLAT